MDIKRNDAPSADKKEGSEEAPPPPRLKQLQVTKTGPIYHEVALQENGASWERWVFLLNGRNFRLVKQGNSQSWERIPESMFGEYERYESADFEGGEWIIEKNYRGASLQDKVPVHVFEVESPIPFTRQDAANYYEGSEANGRIYKASAMLDVKTLLPLETDNGREVRTYTYGKAPSSRLSPPAEVLAELKKWVSELDRLNRVN